LEQLTSIGREGGRSYRPGHFTAEVRPTGDATTPYIGTLRYCEEVYACDRRDAACLPSSRTEVTEFFRHQAGGWTP
jgi:hypothetical protein